MSFGFVHANWLLPNYSKSPFVKKKPTIILLHLKININFGIYFTYLNSRGNFLFFLWKMVDGAQWGLRNIIFLIGMALYNLFHQK